MNAGNLIRDFETETEALAVVRDFLADGWSADDLALGQEWGDGETGDDEQLSPTLSGAALLTRVRAAAATEQRRSA
ncbi:MAG: hypothetical protein AB7P40_08065 [Chloroflexota bacterium]